MLCHRRIALDCIGQMISLKSMNERWRTIETEKVSSGMEEPFVSQKRTLAAIAAIPAESLRNLTKLPYLRFVLVW
jgi:hypothetical protein